MGISHMKMKVIHKGASHKKRSIPLESRATTPSATCETGGFYLAPKIGDVVDSLKPLPLTWDPTCLNATEIDIYLIANGASNARIHMWEKVALKRKTYNLDLKPRWWNATASQSLQLTIVPAGVPPFLSQLPAGPVFTATYTAPADGSIPEAANVQKIDLGYTMVNDLGQTKKSSGKTAAAVLIPMIIIGLCVAAFFKWKRSRGLDKRKKWTEAVDKRMSTISTDWKSVSAAGATAAIRNSMAVGNRNSSFSFAIRPSSTYVTDDDGNISKEMRRPGVGLRNPNAIGSGERVSRVSFAADRVSRVSFANDPRPSSESRRTKAFRDSYVPPVPALPPNGHAEEYTATDEKASEGSLSPRQAQGPLTLTPEDIRARIAAGRARANTVTEKDVTDEMDEVMPALSLMRTGGTDPSGKSDDFLFSNPAPPAPAHSKPVPPSDPVTSPVMSTMPMQPMPASVMSPDDMLRAYAERKKSMSHTASPVSLSRSKSTTVNISAISYPMPVANVSTGRALFNGTTLVSRNDTGGSAGKRTSQPTMGFAPGEYDPDFNFANTTGDGPADGTTNNMNAFGYSSAYADQGHGDAYGGYEDQNAAYDYAQATGHARADSVGVGAYGGASYAIGEDEDDAPGGMAGRGTFAAGGNVAGRGAYGS